MPPLKAFLVEDSPVILDNLVATLRELAGVEVVGTVGDERAARTWLEQSKPAFDLMIVDIVLRSGSGFGVLRAAAAHAAPRVVLTNYATADVRRRCAELGADRVFDKSHELEDLISYCAEFRARLADQEPPLPSALH